MNLLLLWSSLLSHFLSAGPAPVRVTLTRVDKTAYVQARKGKVAAMPALAHPVVKRKGQIVIATTSGKRVFTDKVSPDDETQQRTHEYLGFLPKTKEHLIKTSYWEGADYTLIESDGSKIKLISPPSYSPNQQNIITSSCGLVYEMMPNSVQVLTRKNGRPALVWKVYPTQWEPVEVFWVFDSVAYLKQQRFKFNENKEAMPYEPARFTYAKLLVH